MPCSAPGGGARRADPLARRVAILVDGQPVTAREGDSVAAALLAAGFAAFRTTPVTGAPRGPFCGMGGGSVNRRPDAA